ncbi:protein of unknown function [Taphrina deformans PYCC 5710]|uniref:Uncharacterized protein n=1 Tax=Taphrina deformans (strain PYCC 5710 / ATCC 11124 / CBS 356.35 / IMI 108563 / JCM 9778 / NBRC 8474) TaxID=1097556 RepID=R4X8M5_TAPDE|nr:protein of unknown function [Taphrina deformans PYCC 5710]|eukprot:CCG81720.1 protein of unknown function [Taphrina deformans PYCC 5710]
MFLRDLLASLKTPLDKGKQSGKATTHLDQGHKNEALPKRDSYASTFPSTTAPLFAPVDAPFLTGEVQLEPTSAPLHTMATESAQTLVDVEPKTSSGLQSSLRVENPSLSELELSLETGDEATKLLKLLEKRLGKQKKIIWTPESSITQLDDQGGIHCGSVLSFKYNEKDFDCVGDALEGPSTRRTLYSLA